MKDMLIINGRIITGDGRTEIALGTVMIRGGLIADFCTGRIDGPEGCEVIDATGCTVIPGIINGHAHGCISGPSMPSASLPLSPSDIDYQRTRHLLSGTTTLLNVCGLALAEEISGPGVPNHPLDIALSTAHTPSNLAAACAVDGAGLGAGHHTVSIEEMVEAGAVALGEAGGGQTLGGGAQDYRFIPQAILSATGVLIRPAEARMLKEAVVGRKLDSAKPDIDAVEHLLKNSPLSGRIDAETLSSLIADTVMPPVAMSLTGFEEIAAASARLRLPAIFHNAAPTASTLISLAEKLSSARMIAAHSNHPSFLLHECLETARALRSRGVIIDVSTLDCVSTRWRNGPENIDLLVVEGLVDTISTDFAGGDWDTILQAIHRIVRLGQMTLPQAVALATGNVSRSLPELAGDRGLIEKGRRADLVIVESNNVARVRHVLSRGRRSVVDGAMHRPR